MAKKTDGIVNRLSGTGIWSDGTPKLTPQAKGNRSSPQLESKESPGAPMTITNLRIILIFAGICGGTALISSVFGLKGTHFILTVHTFMSSFLVVLIDDGRIQ